MQHLKLKFTAYARKNRKNATITGRIYTDKLKKEFSTPYIINPKHWDAERQRVISDCLEHLVINDYLGKTELKFQGIVYDAQRNEQELSVKKAERLLNMVLDPPKSCVEYFEMFNEKRKMRNSNKGMMQKYNAQLRNLKDFFCEVYQNENVMLSDLNPERLGNDMLDFFETKRIYKRNYARKLMLVYQSFFTFCKVQEFHKEHFLRDYILPKRENTSTPPFTLDEIKKLKDAFYLSEHLKKVRDCLLFHMYIGLSYIDLRNLTKNDLIQIKGAYYVEKNRQKTSQSTFVPLFEKAEDILINSFDNNVENVCKISNQRYNTHLKTIGRSVGIPLEKMITRTARSTFAWLQFNGDEDTMSAISKETVSKMMGHSNPKTTVQYYAKPDRKRVIDETRHLTKAGRKEIEEKAKNENQTNL